jgi:hypothetical protein
MVGFPAVSRLRRFRVGIFGGNTLYATCALAASGVLVMFNYQHHPTPGLLVGALTGTVLCLLKEYSKWVEKALGISDLRSRLQAGEAVAAFDFRRDQLRSSG